MSDVELHTKMVFATLDAQYPKGSKYRWMADYIADAIAEIQRLRSGWMPIETAPKDGTAILVYADVATVDIVHIAFWCDEDEDFEEGWWSNTHNSVGQELLQGYKLPSHWMPYQPPQEPK